MSANLEASDAKVISTEPLVSSTRTLLCSGSELTVTDDQRCPLDKTDLVRHCLGQKGKNSYFGSGLLIPIPWAKSEPGNLPSAPHGLKSLQSMALVL